MAESLRKAREENAPELRLPDPPRPEQLVERHREWIAATTAAPYQRRQRRRARPFRGASLVFTGAVGLALVAVLLAVSLTGRGDEGAPVRDGLIPGGTGPGAVWGAEKGGGAAESGFQGSPAAPRLPSAAPGD